MNARIHLHFTISNIWSYHTAVIKKIAFWNFIKPIFLKSCPLFIFVYFVDMESKGPADLSPFSDMKFRVICLCLGSIFISY
jgi:hypothetical protein